MYKILISILIFFTCNSLFSQRIRITDFRTSSDDKFDIAQDTLKNEVVNTPYGPALRTNVHYVDDDHHLQLMNNKIEIIQTQTGKTKSMFDFQSGELDSKRLMKSENFRMLCKLNSQDGWITYAQGQIYVSDPKPTFFNTEWIVPCSPQMSNDQVIFIFNGLVGYTKSENTSLTIHILQPVLQWGKSAAGGGKYWGISNWFVTSKGQFFFDTLIKVNTGEKLQGVIRLTSNSDTTFNYNSSFLGYSAGLSVFNLPRLQTPYIALEAYNITSCNEYPVDEKIRMFNIQIKTDSVYPPLICQVFNDIDNCGQFTNIIDRSSDNGEVNIHFHKPHSPDGFEDIYLYPNPVRDNIHFSITDPLYNCRIEVYNNLGNLTHTEIHKTLEYAYDLNFRNYAPGLYIIKFYFQKDLLTREDSHVFKIIKI